MTVIRRDGSATLLKLVLNAGLRTERSASGRRHRRANPRIRAISTCSERPDPKDEWAFGRVSLCQGRTSEQTCVRELQSLEELDDAFMPAVLEMEFIESVEKAFTVEIVDYHDLRAAESLIR
jgi:hypothetical protein